MRALLVLPVALLVLATFAGCLGGADPKDDVTLGDGAGPSSPLGSGAGGNLAAPPTGDDVTTEEVKQGKKVIERLTSAAAPTWTKGRSWSVTLNESGAPEASFSLVVVDDATDYVVGTEHRDLTYRDALREDLWFLGPVRKDDLAPVVAGAPVPFVQWPLEDAKTWSAADANGVSITWRAAYDAALPVGDTAYQGFTVSGADGNGTLVYEYAYVPDAKWFAFFVIHDPEDADGDNTVFRLTTTAFAETSAGEVLQLTTEWLYGGAPFSSPTHTRSAAITVPAGLTSLFVFMHLTSGDAWSGVQGYSNATLLDPSNRPAMWHFRVMLVPEAWDVPGGVIKGAACGQAVKPPHCGWDGGNPWRPYVQNFTGTFDGPAAGSWTLNYVHGGTSDLRTRVGVAGIVETSVKA